MHGTATAALARRKPVYVDLCRQRKCYCTRCGYIVRTTKKWIDLYGTPMCPGGAANKKHEEPRRMKCDEL